MCFSATANFVASGVIASMGVATLRQVDQPRALLFAAMPVLFALHQFTEAFVWLGLEGEIGPIALAHSVFLFMLYAQGILPLLMTVQSLYVALGNRKPPVSERDIDAIRPFFNDAKLRAAFSPVEIIHRQTAPVLETAPPVRVAKPKLGLLNAQRE